ncbi:glycosyltransferase family 4 protein [Undibacterium sp. SXout20W]|uniref:glycosyltransferase family 4 protein n=1 Tax=Undibacterium sp. SXout20W TaxID=3413051 RepID=UPI003BF227BF
MIRVAIAYNFNDQDWLGGKNYFASLFGALRHIEDAGIKLVFVTGKKTVTSLPEEFPELEVIRTPLMDRMHPLWLLRQFTIRKLDSDPLLKQLLGKHHIDILSHSGHLGRNSPIKCLPWLYDFQFMHLPEYWEPKHIKWAEQRYRSACKNADGIIVSSNDALKDLYNFAPWCQIPKHVLQFVSNPVDFARIQPRETIRKKYDLPEKYFYLPNQFWSNKNHRLVIDALAILKEEGIEVTVACSGKTFDGRKPEYFQRLMDYCEQRGVSGLFKVLGMIPYSDLQSLMRYASAVINPSKFEGWSTTVEEAKTFHQKLLLSNISVHKEQAAQVGAFFDVDDPEALADLLNERVQQQAEYASEEVISSNYLERLSMFGKRYVDIVTNAAKK